MTIEVFALHALDCIGTALVIGTLGYLLIRWLMRLADNAIARDNAEYERQDELETLVPFMKSKLEG